MSNDERMLDQFLRANPLAFEVAGYMVRNENKVTITEIANALGRKQPSVHRVLQRLLELGLVEKEPSGKFTYYHIPLDKKNAIDKAIHAQALSRGEVQPPLFMLLSIESGVSRILMQSLEEAHFNLTRNKTISGKNFEHEFDIVIEDRKRMAVEIISAGEENNQKLFEIAGRIADLQKTSVQIVFLVVLGHLRLSSIQYLKSLTIKDAPQVEVITVDRPLSDIDEETIRSEVVGPIIKMLNGRQREK